MSEPLSKISTGFGEEREIPATCEKHGPYTAKVVRLIRREIASGCPVCAEERKAEEEAQERRQEQERKRLALLRLIGRSGIPERFQGRTFDNYRAECDGQRRALAIAKAYADRFEDRLQHGGGLVFCGKPGTGKTHLATAIGNQVMRDLGRSVLFVTVMRALRTVKETWQKDAEQKERDVINGFMSPDLLILDEIGVQFGSEAERLILFEIINGRYEAMRPTILLSNLPESELAEFIGVRTLDRMQEGGGAVVAFDWDSYRGRVHKDDSLPVREVEPPKVMFDRWRLA